MGKESFLANSHSLPSTFVSAFLISVISWAFNCQICFAQKSQILAAAPLIPAHALKTTPSTFEFYQYDATPLGDRAPLLLVHGLEGEFHPLFRWKELAQYLSEDPEFQHRYKIYLARFKTRTSLDEMTETFKQAVRGLPNSEHLTIVAISMACQMVRCAMHDPEVNQSISRVITLGGFFRGSPLFCPAWVKESLEKRHWSPLYRMDRYLGYKLYFYFHKNLLQDFVWDNVDGQMPAIERGNHTSGEESLTRSAGTLSAERQAGDEKFVVYTGYLHNLHTPPLTGAERISLHNPITFLRTTVPTHFGRERPVLRFLNELIAETMPNKNGESSFIYPLNDGISPISSGLLLPDDFVARAVLRKKQDVLDLASRSFAKKARLFDNIDHLTYIEGRRRFRPAVQVTDVLAPNEKPQPIFSFILKDILDPSQKTQATNSFNVGG